jgi:hypothetical protein
VAEDVVEHVRLFDVVQPVGIADELTGGKAPVRQMLEEDRVRNEPRHRNDLPSRMPGEHVAQAPEVRNRASADRQLAHARDELIAGTAGEQADLTLEEPPPRRMFLRGVALPALVYGPVVALGRRTGQCAVLHGSGLVGRSAPMP